MDGSLLTQNWELSTCGKPAKGSDRAAITFKTFSKSQNQTARYRSGAGSVFMLFLIRTTHKRRSSHTQLVEKFLTGKAASHYSNAVFWNHTVHAFRKPGIVPLSKMKREEMLER
ncbi:hypothetical protein IQ268_06685 [Oculatella sp. LEGE 06141]|uniref:hypothetical protein n=1 Tax=Oculatella sp. LEGE 06141 TaxID=1828648 RepID=UPI0019F4A45B|nr:hypothetical protein [Oculatella sp. LEGE 06141]